MFRIVGLNRSSHPEEEFVLLHHQGRLRSQLKGHAIISESEISGDEDCGARFFFRDDVEIPSGAFVLLKTGRGENRWSRTVDGYIVYVAFMGCDHSVWSKRIEPLHLMAPHHTFTPQREEAYTR
ncbi:MAG: hypothetical protein ACOCX1_00075 [Fimbriimonadaceae bacterium]